MVEAEVLKKKKKKSYLLIAKEFDNVEIGETLASEDNFVIGRTIEVSLAQLTNDPKMQNVKVKFKVKEIKEGKGYVELDNYSMVPTYIRRIVRPGREKIEDSFELKTKDDVKIRVKPLLITKAETQNSVLSSLIKKTRELLNDYCKKNDYNQFLFGLISHNIHKELRDSLKKIYPLSVVEIRLMEKL